jgi:hypothetical protein
MQDFKFVNVGFSSMVALHQIQTVSDPDAPLSPGCNSWATDSFCNDYSFWLYYPVIASARYVGAAFSQSCYSRLTNDYFGQTDEGNRNQDRLNRLIRAVAKIFSSR